MQPLFIISLLLFISVFSLVYAMLCAIWDAYQRAKQSGYEPPKRPGLITLASPLITILVPLNRRLGFENYKEKTRQNLTASGNSLELTVEEFMALKEIAAIGVPILVYLIFPRLPLFFFLLLGGAGLYLPDLQLNSIVKQRRAQILLSMPYVLDLLAVSVNAGLDFSAAVSRIVKNMKTTRDPFLEELAYMMQEIKMGKTRKRALRTMGKRVNLPELTLVVTSLVQSDQLGTGIGKSLQVQAEQMRLKRSQRAEKLAQEAPVKMMFPLILFIFPAVFIVLLGPVLIQFL
jgi:tight adherence protein C